MRIISRLKKLLRAKIRYELGIDKLERNNESLFFLFNNVLDITQIPKTKDINLRWVQKCDAILLLIFDKLCDKYSIEYFISFGTLLGAVRHKGFIPWDDDVDVFVKRVDLERIAKEMKNDFNRLGLSLSYSPLHPLRGLILDYNTEKTGVEMDIFALDPYITDEGKDVFANRIPIYREFYFKNINASQERLQNYKSELFPNNPNGKNIYYLGALETWQGCKNELIYRDEDLFPLQKIEFEGYLFNAPANFHKHLEINYGKNYMQFPRNAINNHGLADSLSLRAKHNGINMADVYHKLLDIYNQLLKETE